MKQLRQTITIFTLILLVISHTASAANPLDNRTLKVVFTEFPPYTFTDKEGLAQGYFVNLVADMLEQKAIPHEFIALPTPRIHFQMKSGEADIYLGPRGVPNLQEHIRIVPIPEAFSIKLFLWRNIGTADIHSLSELNNTSLAILNGFGYGGALQQLPSPGNHLHIVRSASHLNALKLLISNRVDYLLNYERPTNAHLHLLPDAKLLKHPIQTIKVAFMVSRHVDQSREIYTSLKDSVDQHFSSVRTNP